MNMAAKTTTSAASNGQITFDCPCGEEISISPEQLGKEMHCDHCDRLLRPALRFYYMERDLAPNFTALCMCGYFVVQPPDSSGKIAQCPVCKRYLKIPEPFHKQGVPSVRRVRRKVLQEQMRKIKHEERAPAKPSSQVGRITLRPGEAICVNLSCGAFLPAKANVCPKCGTNRRTSRLYTGPGPEGDPVGKWKEV
jgi:hypothetical protein